MITCLLCFHEVSVNFSCLNRAWRGGVETGKSSEDLSRSPHQIQILDKRRWWWCPASTSCHQYELKTTNNIFNHGFNKNYNPQRRDYQTMASPPTKYLPLPQRQNRRPRKRLHPTSRHSNPLWRPDPKHLSINPTNHNRQLNNP